MVCVLFTYWTYRTFASERMNNCFWISIFPKEVSIQSCRAGGRKRGIKFHGECSLDLKPRIDHFCHGDPAVPFRGTGPAVFEIFFQSVHYNLIFPGEPVPPYGPVFPDRCALPCAGDARRTGFYVCLHTVRDISLPHLLSSSVIFCHLLPVSSAASFARELQK